MPAPLRQDFRDTPLEGLTNRLVKDAYLVGLRATALARQTYHYQKVLQGQPPKEWLESWEQRNKERDEEHERVMRTIHEEKKKIDQARETAQQRVGELEVQSNELREENSRLKGEIKELKEAQVSRDQEIRALEGKIAEGEDAALGAFLRSHAYGTAAYVTASVDMRRVLHGVVDALTDHWPLKAEEFGILEVPDDENPPDLSGYRWDRLNDRMVSPDGEILEAPVICPDPSTFAEIKPTHPWPKQYYPYEDEDTELAEVIAAGEKAIAQSSGSKKKRHRSE